jgi:tRNA A37 N6-isopentenylltransferase MiaA
VLAGKMDHATAVALATRSTRQFARRQRTWFRAEAGARWVHVTPEEPPATTADRLQALFTPG